MKFKKEILVWRNVPIAIFLFLAFAAYVMMLKIEFEEGYEEIQIEWCKHNKCNGDKHDSST